MRKKAFLLSILSLIIFASNHGHAVAAACANSSTFGMVEVQLPALPAKGLSTIWTRLQVPDGTHNQYDLEVNGQACYRVGGSSITPGQWTWVSFQDGNLSEKVQFNFTKTTGNSVKLIGLQAGVKIDRLILVKNDCIPAELGTNCQSDSSLVSTERGQNGATQLPPLVNGPVSGLIVPSPTITQDPAQIIKVIYFSDGVPVPTASGNALDTTLLGNGPHQISIQITKTDGSIVNEAILLQVKNPQNTLSSLSRWSRLHKKTAVILSIFASSLLVLSASILLTRHILLKRRLLTFHGF